MRWLRWTISWLFFRFCYEKDELAKWITVRYVPGLLRKLNGSLASGEFYIAEINRITGEQRPLVDIRLYPREREKS